MNIVWILTSEAPDNESIIDRTSLISEGTPGGQYENIRLFDEFKSAGFSVKIINPKIFLVSIFVLSNKFTLGISDLNINLFSSF